MIETAKDLVKRYIDEHNGKEKPDVSFALFVVWEASVLENFKCAIATTRPYGMYFELTYDGSEKCWYMDVYRKTENRVIPHD